MLEHMAYPNSKAVSKMQIKLGELAYNSIVEFIRHPKGRLNHLSFGVFTCEYSILTIQNKDEIFDARLLSSEGIHSLLEVRKAEVTKATLRMLYDDAQENGSIVQININLSGSEDFIERNLVEMK